MFLFRGDVEENYFAAIIDKHQKAQVIHQPKILLTGGSNLAFGINSDSIEKALHRPVVNLGLYAGLGLNFILKETLSEVKKNDLVILCPEFYLKKEGEEFPTQTAIFFYPPAFHFVEKDDWQVYTKKKLFFYARYCRNLIVYPNLTSPKIEDTFSDYFRRGFSEKGDLLSHLNNLPIRPLKDLENFQNQGYSVEIRLINDFIKEIERIGGKVIFAFPSYSNTGYVHNKSSLDFYEKQIKSNLNCLIINRIKDEVYPDGNFYNTHYHLAKNGRDRRTNQLIERLKSLKMNINL
jgi:hypothetical protein